MRVIRASAMGMCFGVRDALATIARIGSPRDVTIFGELVHNETVNAELARRGFAAAREDDRDRVPATPAVLVTAHGLSDRDRARLAAAGKEVLDTTCPLVRRAHDAARALAAEDRHVVVVGRPGHVEVTGLTGDLDDFSVVSGPDDARPVGQDRIGVVFQTTTPTALVEPTLRAIRAANPGADVHVVDTICRPTKDRQAALDELLAVADAIVVVGGRRSNNTRALVREAARSGKPVLHVASAAGIDARRLAGCRTVGLTAGTSTLPGTIDEVERALRRIPFGQPLPRPPRPRRILPSRTV